jgi:hypothetical protein
MFFTGRQVCEFCGLEHKDNCDFEYDDKKPLKDILNKIKDNRDFTMVVNFKQNTDRVNFNYFEKIP